MQVTLATAIAVQAAVIALLAVMGVLFGGFTDMAERSNALKRILMFLNLWTIGGFIVGLILFFYFFYAVADILISLILGYRLPQSSIGWESFRWWVDAHRFALFGRGSADWLPFI